MFGSKGGEWATTCETDPRFNLSGRAYGMVGAHKAIDEAIRTKQAELGLTDEQMDKLKIETSFWKD